MGIPVRPPLFTHDANLSLASPRADTMARQLGEHVPKVKNAKRIVWNGPI